MDKPVISLVLSIKGLETLTRGLTLLYKQEPNEQLRGMLVDFEATLSEIVFELALRDVVSAMEESETCEVCEKKETCFPKVCIPPKVN